jgi:hypothetical protein
MICLEGSFVEGCGCGESKFRCFELQGELSKAQVVWFEKNSLEIQNAAGLNKMHLN